jgi:hypothetical protein
MSKVGPWYPRVVWCPDKKEWECTQYSLLNSNIDIHKHFSKGWFVNTSNHHLYKFFKRDEDYEPIYFSSFTELMKEISAELNKHNYLVDESVISFEEAIKDRIHIMDTI